MGRVTQVYRSVYHIDQRELVSKEIMAQHPGEYYKITWFYQLD